MPIPMEEWKEESLEPGSQDLPPGFDSEVAPSGMTEEHASAHGIEARSDTPSPSTGEVSHHLGRRHQVIHSNST